MPFALWAFCVLFIVCGIFFRLPVTGGKLFSRWGPRMMGGRFFHDGSDIAVPRGTPVRAVSGGRVKEVSFTARKGNYLVIAHFPGVESVYLHLDKTRVSPGERVNKKTVIGFSGSSGFSTGPHLHFEIRLFSVPFPAYLMCLPGRLFRAARGLERGTASGGGD